MAASSQLSIEHNKQLALRWFDEVWNRGSHDTIAELLHADGVLHDGAREFRGPGEFLVFYNELHAQFADFHIVPVVVLAEGNFVGLHWSAAFRHKASGNPVHVTGTSIIRVDAGRFVEAWQNWDAAALQAQLAGL